MLTSSTSMSNSRKTYFMLNFFKNTYSCGNILQIFFYFTHNIKKWGFDIHFNIKIPSTAPPPQPLPVPLGFTSISDTWRGQKSRGHVVLSLAQHQSAFRSVSDAWQSRVGGGGSGSSVGSHFYLFLSGLMALHHSGKIPETVELYYTLNNCYWR